MADKVTIMVLKVVDLHCCSCYKKIKKVLCKFPEIRNQVFDEKANTVTITVVCCNPERIRDKLYCKGGKTIKSIEIKPPPPPPPPPPSQNSKPKPPPSPECKCKPEKPPSECKCKPPPPHECKCKPEKPPSECKCKPPPPPALVVCCRQCSEGHSGGPCYQWYGRPVPFYDGYGYGYCEKKICYVSRCDYFNEEYTSGCTVM